MAAILVGALITLVAALCSALKKDQKKVRMAAWAAFVGGCIVLVGGIFADIQQAITKNLLLVKTEEIARLSGKTLGHITGGDSYPYIGCSEPDSTTNTIYCALYSIGEFPLYGIRIHLTDLTMFSRKLDPADPLFREKFAKIADEGQQTIWVGDVERQTKVPLGYLPFPAPQREQDYKFRFTGRNGLWVQLVQWRWIKGRWERASRLGGCLEDSVSILLEDISDEFPRSEMRELRWN